MKHYILCMFIQCIFTISLSSSVDLKLFSSSPIGPYRIVFKQVYNCSPTQNTMMQFNMSLSHRDNRTMLVSNSSSTIQFDDNLLGPFQMVFKQVYNCNPTKNNKIQHNVYISHRANSTFIQGNITNEIPIDDILFLEIKMALKDSFGRWRENAFVMKSPKACSTLKQLMGNIWTAYKRGVGLENTDCPIPPGIYIAPGMDTSIFNSNNNFPKSFLYGTYKLHLYYSRNDEIFGCQVFIMNIKRP